MADSSLAFTPATELARLIRQRALSPVELVDSAIERIERLDPYLNAIPIRAFERAREEAKAAEAAVPHGGDLPPLHGIPTVIKDLTPTAGIRTTYASRLYEHNVPNEDGLIVQRLRGAGAIVLGKSATPEFGHKGVTDSGLFGVTRNPWNLDRTPGGSSGGAGAALAAGLVPVAHGTDGAGSVRNPASFCGLAGLKPTFGRVARWPQPDAFQNMSHDGPMARTVGDVALMLSVIAGPDPRDPASHGHRPLELAATVGDLPPLRIGFCLDFGYTLVDPDVRRIVAEAMQVFGGFGGSLEEVTPDWDDPTPAVIVTFYAGMNRVLVDNGDDALERVDRSFRHALESALSFTAREVIEANMVRTRFFQRMVELFSRYDLLLTPTCPVVAHPLDDQYPKVIEGQAADGSAGFRFMSPFNLTGQPAMSVPAGWNEHGLPCGLQIVGRRGEDELVLRAAAAYEAVRPWAHRRPPAPFG